MLPTSFYWLLSGFLLVLAWVGMCVCAMRLQPHHNSWWLIGWGLCFNVACNIAGAFILNIMVLIR